MVEHRHRAVIAAGRELVREPRRGHGVVATPQDVLQRGERVDIVARAVAVEKRGEEFRGIAELLRRDPQRMPLGGLSGDAGRGAADQPAMAAAQQLARES